MNSGQQRINRIFTLARKAAKPSTELVPAIPPFGFTTRVASRWAAARRVSTADAWERVCWWGAGVAAAVCLVAGLQQRWQAEPTAMEMLMATTEETESLF